MVFESKGAKAKSRYPINHNINQPLDRRQRKLITKNWRFICMLARTYASKYNADEDDILEVVMVATVRAAQLFDPTLRVKFTTYAAYWARSAVTDFTRKRVRSMADLDALLDKIPRVPKRGDAEMFVHRDEGPAANAELNDIREQVRNIVYEKLSPRDAFVVMERMKGEKLETIGDQLLLCRERIRQIQIDSLDKLKGAMEMLREGRDAL